MRFGITEEAEIDEEPRFNIAPTDPVLAVRERADEREIGTLRWGLVPGKWATEKKGRPLINARAESIATQPAFAESFRERRCLIPADGFYEWRRDENGKVPIWLHLPDDELFAFAGIWASYEPKGGEPIVSCSIVTTAAERHGAPDPRPDAGDPAARGGGGVALRRCVEPDDLMRPAGAVARRARDARGHRPRQQRARGRAGADRAADGGDALLGQAGLGEGSRLLALVVVVVPSSSSPGERAAADRPLLLDVPLLAEGDERDDDRAGSGRG